MDTTSVESAFDDTIVVWVAGKIQGDLLDGSVACSSSKRKKIF